MLMNTNRFTQAFSGFSKHSPRLMLASAVAVAGLVSLVGHTAPAQAGLDDYKNAGYFDRYNPRPSKWNTKKSQWGFGGNSQDNPNAVQLKGKTMRVKKTNMFDNFGNKINQTKEGKVGYYSKHYGKLHAGAWAKIHVDGKSRECLYLNAVPVTGGGTFSGWVRADRVTPSDALTVVKQMYQRRESSNVRYTKNSSKSRYNRMTVQNRGVPSKLKDGYIIPNRTSSAGKVSYYYIRDGLLNGFINLPETGNKRHGVQATRVKPGQSFWRDKDVNYYTQTIYKRNSKTKLGTFQFAYGYYKTNTGQRIYCWTNRACLKD